MAKMTMPVNQYLEDLSNGNTNKGGGSTYLYKPLPFEGGLSIHNNVVIPLFSPEAWRIFNPTPEEVQKYGFIGDGTGLIGVTPGSTTYFVTLHTHRVSKFQHATHTGFANVLCPVKLNQELPKLGISPIFDAPVRCAFCEMVSELWEEVNARWDELGIEKGSLSTDGYRDLMSQDPVLRPLNKLIRQTAVQEKHIFSVFDHDKFVETRQLDEGQEAVALQSYMAPYSVAKKLGNLFMSLSAAEASGSAVTHFFDVDAPAGVPLVTIVKDAVKCKGKNMMLTEYDVITGTSHPPTAKQPYTAEWLAYFQNQANHIDPSSYLALATYEEGQRYAAEERSGASGFNKTTTAYNAPAAAPPPAQTAAPMQQLPPPQAPQAQAQPPAQAPPPMQAQLPPPAQAAQAQLPPPAQAPAQAVPAQASPPAMPVQAQPPVPATPFPVAPQQQQQAAPPVPQMPPQSVGAADAMGTPPPGGAPLPDRNPPPGAPPAGRRSWDN